MGFILKWSFWVAVWIVIAGFLHYTLPQTDIVRITGTEVRRVDFGENSIFWAAEDSGQTAGGTNRDVRFINTFYYADDPTNAREMVFRNEDTGWGWPPYFKFNSSNVQAQAENLRSDRDNPQWVAIRHYGWRNEFLSIFPNAVSLRPVAGPDVRIIPYFSILIWVVVIMIIWFITARWIRFKRRNISPALDAVDARFDETRGRFSRWLGTWRRKN